jgi:alpha-D-xyloside xylohydrolase
VADASGTIVGNATVIYTTAFNTNTVLAQPLKMLDFPFSAYDNDPALKFSIDFISPRTVRIRMMTSPVDIKEEPSLMLAKEPEKDQSWKVEESPSEIRYTNFYGSITIDKNPWRIVLRDAEGKIMTKTRTLRI